MTKKLLTIQDISCYGQCSITVSLPILSAFGIETAILPSAILSTHTAGFKNFTVKDLTDEMPKIINHWIVCGIKFDCIYTGYIGDARQFDYILSCKDKLLKDNGIFVVDPAMADNGKLYTGLNDKIVEGMKLISSKADYVIPNITEGCFLTNNNYEKKDYTKIIKDLYNLGAKNIILTGVEENNKIGAISYNGNNIIKVLKEKISKCYHGTGDIFSSIIIANILNDVDIESTLANSCNFVIDCIKNTIDDNSHNYGVKFEEILLKNKDYYLKSSK